MVRNKWLSNKDKMLGWTIPFIVADQSVEVFIGQLFHVIFTFIFNIHEKICKYYQLNNTYTFAFKYKNGSYYYVKILNLI